MLQIKKQFRVKEKAKLGQYLEIRILFDEYGKADSLKGKMRYKRAYVDPRDGDGYEFHDEM